MILDIKFWLSARHSITFNFFFHIFSLTLQVITNQTRFFVDSQYKHSFTIVIFHHTLINHSLSKHSWSLIFPNIWDILHSQTANVGCKTSYQVLMRGKINYLPFEDFILRLITWQIDRKRKYNHKFSLKLNRVLTLIVLPSRYILHERLLSQACVIILTQCLITSFFLRF